MKVRFNLSGGLAPERLEMKIGCCGDFQNKLDKTFKILYY